jgi:antitoxin (DNA-binding transcriptional repressor) of toxin-antitoxin stability system
MVEISIEEITQNPTLYLDRTEIGESFIILKAGQPIAQINPIVLSPLIPASPAAAWNAALQKLQTPASPTQLTDLLQTWEDESNTQDQQETWDFLQQNLDQDRSSDRPLFP